MFKSYKCIRVMKAAGCISQHYPKNNMFAFKGVWTCAHACVVCVLQSIAFLPFPLFYLRMSQKFQLWFTLLAERGGNMS